MKFKNAIVFLLIIGLIGSCCSLGVLAQSKEVKTAEINQTVTDISGNTGTSMKIQSMNEVPELDSSSTIDNKIIVIYENQASVGDLSLTTQEIKGGETLNDRVDIVEAAENQDVDSLVTELSSNPNVLVAEKNSYIQTTAIPNDPLLSSAWQFERIGETKTWDQVNNSDPVIVAIIDTGLNTQHPDISGNTVSGYDFVKSTTEMVDLSGHGTNVSGCIAAITNNSLGIAGVAGIANIKIAPYRVGGLKNDDPNLDLGYICAALYDAADRSDVKVINMSFGGYLVSPALQKAVEYASSKGKILVASAGNEGDDPNVDSGEYSIPASYDNVISVGATNSNNTIAYFSQHNNQVDLCAPGENIYTLNHDGGYELESGTSFSSPITAGACAVLIARDPNLSSFAVETILKDTALDLGAQGNDDYYGNGLIQLDAALAAITPSTPLSIDSITADKATGQPVGVPITLSAMAKGGTGAYTYKFYYELNGKTTIIQDYSNANTTTFIPTTPGLYNLSVEVLDGNNNSAVKSIHNYVIKNIEKTSINYRTHVQNVGWQNFVGNGALSGTTGQSLRLEAIEITTDNTNYDLGVKYKTHVQDIGWMDSVVDGTISGTTGQSLRMEAIQIELTGGDAELFDVYYQVHVMNIGWMDWTKNGGNAGTTGLSYRMEGIRIQIVPKGSPAPGSTDNPFFKN